MPRGRSRGNLTSDRSFFHPAGALPATATSRRRRGRRRGTRRAEPLHQGEGSQGGTPRRELSRGGGPGRRGAVRFCCCRTRGEARRWSRWCRGRCSRLGLRARGEGGGVEAWGHGGGTQVACRCGDGCEGRGVRLGYARERPQAQTASPIYAVDSSGPTAPPTPPLGRRPSCADRQPSGNASLQPRATGAPWSSHVARRADRSGGRSRSSGATPLARVCKHGARQLEVADPPAARQKGVG